LIILLSSDERMSEVVAHRGLSDPLVRSLQEESILVVIEVDGHVSVKIDRIRTCGKGAVIVVGIKNLHRERLPSSGRTSIDKSRPTFPNAPELPLDGRNELVLNGIAVRAHIRGVHRIRIVIVRIRVLNLEDEHARKFRRGPLLVKLVRLFLLDAVISGKMK